MRPTVVDRPGSCSADSSVAFLTTVRLVFFPLLCSGMLVSETPLSSPVAKMSERPKRGGLTFGLSPAPSRSIAESSTMVSIFDLDVSDPRPPSTIPISHREDEFCNSQVLFDRWVAGFTTLLGNDCEAGGIWTSSSDGFDTSSDSGIEEESMAEVECSPDWSPSSPVSFVVRVNEFPSSGEDASSC